MFKKLLNAVKKIVAVPFTVVALIVTSIKHPEDFS